MVTLGEVEDKLRGLKPLLQDNQDERLFSHIKHDVGQEERDLLNEKIDYLIVFLGNLKRLFELGESEFALKNIVKTTSVYLSIQLEEAMSDRLKRYGEITNGLRETLDPILIEIISILRQMESIV